MDVRAPRHRPSSRARWAAVVVALLASVLASVAAAGPAAAVTTDPGGFNPLTPTRALDTRNGSGCVAGVRNLTLGGLFGVPADAAAVLLNVTVDAPWGSGFLTVYPAGAARPTASNLNFTPGAIVPNAVTVKLGAGGAISIYASNGCPQVIVDVAGSYTAGPAGGGGLEPLDRPTRLLDTREPGPLRGCLNGTRTLQVPSPSVIPSGALAIQLNVTVVEPSGSGFLTIYPGGTSRPLASSLNYVAGQIVANSVTVKLGVGAGAGQLSFYASNGCPQVVIDAAGSFLNGPSTVAGGLNPTNPTRILDTRTAGQTPCVNGFRRLKVGGSAGVPLSADAVTLNVTAVGATDGGYVTAFPTGVVRPTASNLNYVAGSVVPNSVTVPLGDGRGDVYLYTPRGCPNIVVDVNGWYSESTPDVPDPEYNINVQFADGTDPSTAVQLAFLAAEERWESIITADVQDATFSLDPNDCGAEWTAPSQNFDDVVIGANIKFIDGTSGILGRAGPCVVDGAPGYFPKFGVMEFDSADLDRLAINGTLADTVAHEMAHVLGYGTLWGDPEDPYWDLPQFNGQGMPAAYRSLVSASGTPSTAYTGAAAKAQYAVLGGQGNIPLETGGGDGTADAHWRESLFGNELMTGYINSTNRLSAMSIAAMSDLGYSVDLTRADPYSVASLRSAAVAATPPTSTEPVELVRPSGMVRNGLAAPLGP